jgi:hypothetical protein
VVTSGRRIEGEANAFEGGAVGMKAKETGPGSREAEFENGGTVGVAFEDGKSDGEPFRGAGVCLREAPSAGELLRIGGRFEDGNDFRLEMNYYVAAEATNSIQSKQHSQRSLERSHDNGEPKHRSELCTLYIREHPDEFKVVRHRPLQALIRKDLRLTVDNPEDLVVCRCEFLASIPPVICIIVAAHLAFTFEP